MSQREFTLKYGKGSVCFKIPTNQLVHELLGCNQPPVPDLQTAYSHALRHPIDSAPLGEMIRPGETVAVTVSDITRGWQRNADTLPFLLDALNEAGVPDDKVTIII
nr:lactate racemase domain-containing protein [Desulfobacterales bacterium]